MRKNEPGGSIRWGFFHDDDRRVYLHALAEYCGRYGVRLMGFCLMSNHVHFIAIPEHADAFAKAFGRTHNDYARWLHVRQRQIGHLWQNRFFSCPLDSGYCWAALRYVERNPVRADCRSCLGLDVVERTCPHHRNRR
jgi:putative transposase